MAKRKTKTPARGADIVDEQDGPVQGNDETATLTWKRWRETRTHLKDWRQETSLAYDFVAGHQWTDEEKSDLEAQNRPAVTFNRTGVIIDSVSGYEINNRQDIAFLPRENADTGPVQVETEAGKYYRQQCDAEDEESDGFVDLLICGLATIEHHMDYEDDPDGMMKVERVDPMEMGYDPSATKRNLSDRRWDVRGKWWDEKVAKATWPDHDFTNDIAGDAEDFPEQTPSIRENQPFYRDTGAGEQTDRRKGKVFIIEHTWFEHEPYFRAANPTTGELEETTPAVVKTLDEKLAASGQPPLRKVRSTRKAFKRAFVHGKDTLNLKEMEAPCPHRFHYQFLTGKRDRNKNIWFGLARAMKDPQEWSNKFMSQTMHMINANAKGGLIHDKGAFERPQDIERQMAKPGWRLEKNQGYDAEFVPPTPIPQNTFNLMQFAIGSVRDTTGVNVELLGLADRDQPGVLEHSRKQSAMAILAPFFDSLRRYRKEAGRLTLYFIKEYMSDGRKIRIVSQGQKQYVPVTNVQDFTKYDVIVDQSPSSPNSKEQVFGVLSSIMPMLMKAGIPFPPEFVDSIPGLPAELAQKWKEMLVPDPQKAKAAQLEEEAKKADVEKTHSEALLNEAKAGGEVAKMATMLQQVLVGLSQVQAMLHGAPPPGMVPPGAVGAPGPGAPPPQPMPPQGGPMPPQGGPMPGAPPIPMM